MIKKKELEEQKGNLNPNSKRHSPHFCGQKRVQDEHPIAHSLVLFFKIIIYSSFIFFIENIRNISINSFVF